jgi:hypothetical protein
MVKKVMISYQKHKAWVMCHHAADIQEEENQDYIL